jgi:hypothetical protein
MMAIEVVESVGGKATKNTWLVVAPRGKMMADIIQADRDAADTAFDIAFRGETQGIDEAMAQVFARHRIAALRTPSPSAEPVADAVKPWQYCNGPVPDYDDPLHCVFVSGCEYAIRLLAKTLDVTEYDQCDGTEEFDGDLGGTLFNVVLAAMPKNADGDAMYLDEVREALATPTVPEQHPAPSFSEAQVEEDEAYELGKQDGYSDAIQWVDQHTGGDGEYFASTIPGRGCPGPVEMRERIVERFAALKGEAS